jgi:hypothetical protein
VLRVTVLPLAVVDVRGVVVVGVRVVVLGRVVDVFGAVVLVRGAVADVLGAGAVVVPAGTSVSAGCADVSRFASWMSLLSEVSEASVSSFLAVHAANESASANASDAFSRGIYCNIKPPPRVTIAWVCPSS